MKSIKTVFSALNYVGYFLVFVSAVRRCVSISSLFLLADFHVGVTSSALGLRIFALTWWIKDYTLIIKKKI